MRNHLRYALAALTVALLGVALPLTAGPAAAAPPEEYVFVFSQWWSHWDEPVRQGQADRSWIWGLWNGDRVGEVRIEPYVEGLWEHHGDPGRMGPVVWEPGQRAVAYYDKARMEYQPEEGVYPPPNIDPDANPWKITTGLLATELMTGRLQLGDDTFEQHAPSQAPVAGDPDSGDLTPSYAAMGQVMGYQAIPTGWTIIQTIDANGSVGALQRFAAFGVTAEDVGAPTGHTVASVFWSWMNQAGVTYHPSATGDETWVTERLFANPFYATGYPTTEAYWTRTRVAGVERDVLLQCFERRCLTYTPDNTAGWQVEMANVGAHYYQWRYSRIPGESQ